MCGLLYAPTHLQFSYRWPNWQKNMEVGWTGFLSARRAPSFEGSRWIRLATRACGLVPRRGYLQEHLSIWVSPLSCQIEEIRTTQESGAHDLHKRLPTG